MASERRAQVRDWYIASFRELRRFQPVRDRQDEAGFTDLLRDIYERHKRAPRPQRPPACAGGRRPTRWACRRNVVSVMAMGVADLKRELSERRGFADVPAVHQFLDGFYMSRIGIRILIGQHIALHEPPKDRQIGRRRRCSGRLCRRSPRSRSARRDAGLIHSQCSAIQVAEDAIADARGVCMRQCGSAPDVSVSAPAPCRAGRARPGRARPSRRLPPPRCTGTAPLCSPTCPATCTT